MLVTPVRDGMNLVAKEFVAARDDENGVLVLSEFAGVASEFAEALQLNPYDVDHAAEVYARALTLPAGERRARMRALRRRVFTYDVHHWARSFVQALEAASARPAASPTRLDELARRLRSAAALVLVLDYDGTLVPLATAPDLAAPDDELLGLLGALARRPKTEAHVISGRAPEILERWLGALPLALHAEDGLWSRAPGGPWLARPTPQADWMARVLPILQAVTERTPGSLIEERTASLAWHYRMVEPEFGARQANELRLHLSELLSNAPLEILTGDQVIEVRPHEASKGALVAAFVAGAPPDALVVALGDGRADEGVFATLPPGGIAIHVGSTPSRAPHRLAGVREVRGLLAALQASDGA
jgi:trehalose 6-phosphate synthase/phosphatase